MSEEEEEGKREGVLGGFGGVWRYVFLRWGDVGRILCGSGGSPAASCLGSSDGHHERDELGILSAKRRLLAGCACTYTQSQCPFFLSFFDSDCHSQKLTSCPNRKQLKKSTASHDLPLQSMPTPSPLISSSFYPTHPPFPSFPHFSFPLSILHAE